MTEDTPEKIETGDAAELLELHSQGEDEEAQENDLHARIQLKLMGPDPPEKQGRGMRMAQLHPARADRTPEEIAEYQKLFDEIGEEATADQQRDGCSLAAAQLKAAAIANGTAPPTPEEAEERQPVSAEPDGAWGEDEEDPDAEEEQ